MPARRTLALRPTPDNPGLWVSFEGTPRAIHACRCGYVRDVSGRARVLELVTTHQKHDEVCVLTTNENLGDSARRVARIADHAAGSTPERTERPGGLIPDLSVEPFKSAA